MVVTTNNNYSHHNNNFNNNYELLGEHKSPLSYNQLLHSGMKHKDNQ